LSKASAKVLVVDDERPVLLTLGALLERHGFEVQTASTAAAGLQVFRRWLPDLVLLDLGLPDAAGLEVLGEMKAERPKVQVLILTADDSLSNAIQSIKLGAFHFVSKPYAPAELLSLAGHALDQRRLESEALELREESARLVRRLEEAERRTEPVFQSRSMRQLEELLKRVAPSDANVLLLGESGVGKEVLAGRIHALSRRSKGPMVRLNCAALPANMIEGELFGYVKGAFTGAVSDFAGMISEANGGTLFLDEVAEMPVQLQTRFLRVLQEREYKPLGSTRTLKSDFRLVAATNRSMADALREGLIRQDFYYRLNTFQIEIPPLRERREDIPSLVARFVEQFARRQGVDPPTLRPEVLERLCGHGWPGNIRQLQNTVEYAVILSGASAIEMSHLPPELQAPLEIQNALAQTGAGLRLEQRERETILQTLVDTRGNKKKAAEILGIQRPTLYAKLRRYGIDTKRLQ
jgi:DNA-binding NtrC family response regulator